MAKMVKDPREENHEVSSRCLKNLDVEIYGRRSFKQLISSERAFCWPCGYDSDLLTMGTKRDNTKMCVFFEWCVGLGYYCD